MVYILFAMVFYTAAIMVGAVASRNANSTLVAGIVNAISAIIPLAVAAPLLTRQTLATYKYGVFMAVLGGVFIALFAMSLNKSFVVNKVGIVSPIVFGGAIFLSTILSYLLLKEKVSPYQLAGLGFMAAGLMLIIFARTTGR